MKLFLWAMFHFLAWAAVLLLLAAALVTFGHAQVAVSLGWTASPNATIVNIYRASGNCNSGKPFAKIAGTISLSGPYLDSGITTGQWCYYVTGQTTAGESKPSNKITVTVPKWTKITCTAAIDSTGNILMSCK